MQLERIFYGGRWLLVPAGAREVDARTLQPLQVADQVEGAAAHDAAASGNPVQVGGVFRSTLPAVADGDAASLLMDAAGRVLVRTLPHGVGEVQNIWKGLAGTSVDRATVVTPGSGLRIRVVSVAINDNGRDIDPGRVEVYFGTASVITNAVSKAVGVYNPFGRGADVQGWPEGGGPIGDVDEVLSWRTLVEGDVKLSITVHWREE